MTDLKNVVNDTGNLNVIFSSYVVWGIILQIKLADFRECLGFKDFRECFLYGRGWGSASCYHHIFA